MKRSEINRNIRWSIKTLKKHQFMLPPFAYWTMAEWEKNKLMTDVIQKTMLGWDITDFGSGDFDKIGAALFTIRNGIAGTNIGTPYAEKIILMREGQVLPLHYHITKKEDIINRGGGLVCIQLFNSTADGSIDKESDVTVYCDGIKHSLKAGGILEMTPGNSITITPYLYHQFSVKKGYAVIGEVSSTNDDRTDNYFVQNRERYTGTEEDEPIEIPQSIDIADINKMGPEE